MERGKGIEGAGRSAAVVGAGIGGLAAARALSKAGWEPTVYEAADELRPLGAGLSIWPNGVRALHELGLGEFADAAPRTGGALRRADGSVLAEFEPAAIEGRFGAPLVGVHRADLHEALIGALGADRVRTGMRLLSVDDGEARFDDGSAQPADLIIGADGINSTVREGLLGDGDPRPSGLVAYRGVATVGAEEGSFPIGEWWGPGSAAGLLGLGGGRVYWYVAYRGEPSLESLPGLVSEFGPEVGEVVRRTPEGEVLVHRLYDRDPVNSWSRGNVTLLGDAAHPMLPFLGQGACSALEDAVALGAAVAAEEDVGAALASYEGARRKRTKGLVSGSRKAARAALLGSGAGRALRNGLVSRVPESMRLRQLDSFIGRP